MYDTTRVCPDASAWTTRSDRSEERRVGKECRSRWSRTAITVGAQTFTAADHVPVLIYPNPLNPKRYVVINSGHTFSDADFRGTNAWLYPRLGDYSVLKANGDIAVSGFFNEHWQFK